MARFRRRRFSRSFAGKRGGRRYFWFRFTPFTLALRQAATAVHSDILLQESDYLNPQEVPNDTVRGGARLERFIIDYGLSMDAANAFWGVAGAAYYAMISEFMVWKQSDQLATYVTSATTFSTTRNNERIIMDEVPTAYATDLNVAGTRAVRSVAGRYETKSKVRLADSALAIAWQGYFNTGDASLNGYSDWVRPTLLISMP